MTASSNGALCRSLGVAAVSFLLIQVAVRCVQQRCAALAGCMNSASKPCAISMCVPKGPVEWDLTLFSEAFGFMIAAG